MRDGAHLLVGSKLLMAVFCPCISYCYIHVGSAPLTNHSVLTDHISSRQYTLSISLAVQYCSRVRRNESGLRSNDDNDDDDDCRFVKRITQDASTALRVPVRCEEVSFQR